MGTIELKSEELINLTQGVIASLEGVAHLTEEDEGFVHELLDTPDNFEMQDLLDRADDIATVVSRYPFRRAVIQPKSLILGKLLYLKLMERGIELFFLSEDGEILDFVQWDCSKL